MSIWKKLLLVACLAIATVGCAISPEGIRFASKPDPMQWEKFKNQLEGNKSLAIAELGDEIDKELPGIIVVGRVGPLRSFADLDVFEQAYADHLESFEAIGEPEMALSREELKAVAGGWTTITFAETLFGHFSINSLIQPEDVDEIGFSSLAGTILVGDREDLVAASYTIDFPIFVIRERLCADGEGYSECAARYNPGLYDNLTGHELTRKFRRREEGVRISTKKFGLLQSQ